MRRPPRTTYERWGAGIVVLLLATACGAAPLTIPSRTTAPLPPLPTSETADARTPAGSVSVAYPAQPSELVLPVGRDVAADDLAALWGLPLLRVDDAGQVRRALVEDWSVSDDGGGWAVDLVLRAGTWSDGTTVDSGDVVASIERLRDEDPERFGVVEAVEATGEQGVRLGFAEPYASWPDLLVEAGSMQPSEVADVPDTDDRPVSGGPFVLDAFQPGQRAVFTAHADGPLGPPGLERIQVEFVPDYDTALGLLDEGDVDVVLGHLPINPVVRAEEVDGVTAAAPLGGTTVSLVFRAGGAYGGTQDADRRRGMAEAIDVQELVEGMLGPYGAPASTTWPGVELPVNAPVGEVREGQQVAIVHPRDVETLGFTARVIQSNLAARGVTAELVASPAPDVQQLSATEHDAALVVHRSSRRPSLAPWLEDDDVARQAGATSTQAAEATAGLTAVATEARIVPLYGIGVAHAWRGVTGIRPSSWTGAGFWNAGDWRLAE